MIRHLLYIPCGWPAALVAVCVLSVLPADATTRRGGAQGCPSGVLARNRDQLITEKPAPEPRRKIAVFDDVRLGLRSEMDAAKRLLEKYPSADTHKIMAEVTVRGLKRNGIEATFECLKPPQLNCLITITPAVGELKGLHWITRMATALKKTHDHDLVLDTKNALRDGEDGAAYYSHSRRALAMDWADLDRPHAGPFTLHEGRHFNTRAVAGHEKNVILSTQPPPLGEVVDLELSHPNFGTYTVLASDTERVLIENLEGKRFQLTPAQFHEARAQVSGEAGTAALPAPLVSAGTAERASLPQKGQQFNLEFTERQPDKYVVVRSSPEKVVLQSLDDEIVELSFHDFRQALILKETSPQRIQTSVAQGTRSGFPVLEFSAPPGSPATSTLGSLYARSHVLDEIDAYYFTAKSGRKYARRIALSDAKGASELYATLVSEAEHAERSARRFIAVDRHILTEAITELGDFEISGARRSVAGTQYTITLSDGMKISFYVHQVRRAPGAIGPLSNAEIIKFLRENLEKTKEYEAKLDETQKILSEPVFARPSRSKRARD